MSWWSKEILAPGIGLTRPKFLSEFSVEITTNVDTIENLTVGYPQGLFHIAVEECVQTMKCGESCQISIDVDKCPILLEDSIIPNKAKIKLNSFTLGSDIWEMNFLDRLEVAFNLKQKGVEFYKQNKRTESFYYFSTTQKILASIAKEDFHKDEENTRKLSDLKVASYLNLSACQLGKGSYLKVVKNCSCALELEENNVKALFRKGSALIQLEEFEDAEISLKKALELEPDNKAILEQLKLLSSKVKSLNEYYAKCMKKMFN